MYRKLGLALMLIGVVGIASQSIAEKQQSAEFIQGIKSEIEKFPKELIPFISFSLFPPLLPPKSTRFNNLKYIKENHPEILNQFNKAREQNPNILNKKNIGEAFKLLSTYDLSKNPSDIKKFEDFIAAKAKEHKQ